MLVAILRGERLAALGARLGHHAGAEAAASPAAAPGGHARRGQLVRRRQRRRALLHGDARKILFLVALFHQRLDRVLAAKEARRVGVRRVAYLPIRRGVFVGVAVRRRKRPRRRRRAVAAVRLRVGRRRGAAAERAAERAVRGDVPARNGAALHVDASRCGLRTRRRGERGDLLQVLAPTAHLGHLRLGVAERRRQARGFARAEFVPRLARARLAPRRLGIERDALEVPGARLGVLLRLFQALAQALDVILRAAELTLEPHVLALEVLHGGGERSVLALERRAARVELLRLARQARRRGGHGGELSRRVRGLRLGLVRASLENRDGATELARLGVPRLRLVLRLLELLFERLAPALGVVRDALRVLLAPLGGCQVRLKRLHALRQRSRLRDGRSLGERSRRGRANRRRRPSQNDVVGGGAFGILILLLFVLRRARPRASLRRRRGGGDRLRALGRRLRSLRRVRHVRRVRRRAVGGFHKSFGERERRRRRVLLVGRRVAPLPGLGPDALHRGPLPVARLSLSRELALRRQRAKKSGLVQVPGKPVWPSEDAQGHLRFRNVALRRRLRVAQLSLVVRLHVREALRGFVRDVSS